MRNIRLGRKWKYGLAAALFVFGVTGGVASATLLNSGGDQAYYAGNPFGTYYCAIYDYSLWTNTSYNSDIVETIVDAKARKDVWCVNDAPAPSGYEKAWLQLVGHPNGVSYYCGEAQGVNPNNSNVGRAWGYFSMNSMEILIGSYCGHGTDFRVDWITNVALNFAWRTAAGSSAYASSY